MAELAFRVDIDGQGFAKVKKLSGDFKKADESAIKFGDALKKAGAVAGALAVAGAGVALAIGAMTKKTLEQIDATTKASRAVGIQTELYSGLIHVANLGGVAQESLNASLKRFSRNINDASNGIGTGKRAFEQLGLSIKDSGGELKSQETLMLEVADRFQQMENGAQKTAIAQDIFGRSGADLINVLNGGSDAIRGQLESARSLGLVFSEELGAKAEYFNDRLAEVIASIDGFRLRAVAAFADSALFNTFINGFELMSKAISSFISGEQFSGFLKYIFDTLKNLIEPVSAVIATFKGLGTVLFNIGQIIGDSVVAQFLSLVDVIAGVSRAVAAFVTGDFKNASRIAGETIDLVGDRLSNLRTDTVNNFKDIGAAFVGIKDDYVAMASGLTIAFNQTNEGLEQFKKNQQEASEVVFERAQLELQSAAEVSEAKVEIAKKESDAVVAAEESKWAAFLKTASIYSQTGAAMVGTMSIVFGKNKLFSQAMIIAQGAQAVINGLATPPLFPLGLSLAALATAQTGQALSQLNNAKAFALGGVVGGGEQFIRVNEQGNESVLNASATRSLGRDTIDLLNNGRADMLTRGVDAKPSVSIVVNGVLSRDVYDNEIKKYMTEDMVLR